MVASRFPGLQLAERLAAVNEEVKEVQARQNKLRDMLIEEIAGPDAYPSECKCASPAECTCKLNHIPLKQLVKMKFKSIDSGNSRVSFATTLALRVDQARSLSSAGGPGKGDGTASLKEDTYTSDAFASDGGYTDDEEGEGGKGEGGSGDAGPPGAGSSTPAIPALAADPKGHITQTELRIKQLRA